MKKKYILIILLVAAIFVFESKVNAQAFKSYDVTLTTTEDVDFVFALEYGVTTSTIGFCFDGGTAPIASVTIVSLPNSADGELLLSGASVLAGDIISKADIDAGNLVFRPTPGSTTSVTFDYNGTDSNPTTSADDQVTINITPNDPPTAANSSVTTDEDVDHVFVAGDFNYSDTDGDPISQIRISTTPSVGDLWVDTDGNGSINGAEAAVATNDVILAAAIPDLTFKPVANASGSPYTTFDFEVHDGAVYSVSTYTMTINVNSVNDLPTSSDKTVTTLQETDFTFGSTDFAFSDADPSDNLVQIQISSLATNGTLYLDNSPSNGTIDGGEAITINQVIALADISSLKLKPDVDESGSPYASFQFYVNDGTANSAAAYTMTVNVTLINQEPTFTKGADESVAEDVGAVSVPNWATGVSAGNATEDAIPQVLTFTVTNDNNSLFAVQPYLTRTGATATLSYTPADDAFGTASVGVYVKDDGGTANGGDDTSPSQSFNITVNAVNDAPTISPQTFNVDENSGNGTTVGTVVANDVESDPITFTITAGNTGTAFAIASPSGLLTVNNDAALDYETTTQFSLTIEASDGSLSNSATITVDVNDVNDIAPTINANTYAIDENSPNGTVVSTVTYNEPEGNALTFSILSGNTGGAFTINSSGQISVANEDAVDWETTPTFNLDVQIDDGAFQDNATQTINLNPVNDAPRYTSSPSTIAITGSLYTYNVTTEDDEGENVTITCSTCPGWLSITASDPVARTATLEGTPTDPTDLGNHSIILNAANTLSTQQSFTISVASAGSVTNVPNGGSISAAIAAASDGDIITVDDGTYTENIDFGGKDITLIGNTGDPSQVVIDGGSSGSVVTFNSGETSDASMKGFSIINGSGTSTDNGGSYGGSSNYGGGIFISGASPTLENLLIFNNTAAATEKIGGSGGGLFINDGANPVLDNVEIYSNEAENYRGGGICVEDASVTIKNSSIYNNTTDSYGAGLSLWDGASAILENVSFSGNQANGSNGMGGGVFLNKSSINLTSVTINGNSATDGSSTGAYGFSSTYTGTFSGTDSQDIN